MAVVRRMKKMTQPQFASVIGIAPDHLAKIELGKVAVSDWVANRIAVEFGAIVPRGLPAEFGRKTPRAASSGASVEYRGDLPALTQEALDGWARRLDVILGGKGFSSAGGWDRLVKGIGAARLALSDTRLVRVAVNLTIQGAEREDVLRRLTVALARTPGLEILERSGRQPHGGPDLLVGDEGATGSRFGIEIKQRGTPTRFFEGGEAEAWFSSMLTVPRGRPRRKGLRKAHAKARKSARKAREGASSASPHE